jgi:hypothetical protein
VSAALARAAVVLALALCALLFSSHHVAAGGRGGTPRPRRALTFAPVYTVFPYFKALDCFTVGLAMYPLELAQCVAWSSA